MSLWSVISERIATESGQAFKVETERSVAGGCINSAYKIAGSGQTYFVKTNEATGLAMFEAEAKALQEIAAADAIRVPRPVVWGVADNHTAYLVMEYIEFGSGRGSTEALGEQLAAMHRVTHPQFGWHMDNTIGSTLQPNALSDDWLSFWRDQRLGFQLQLAARNGYNGALQRKGSEVMERFPQLFADYRPEASLLHGDLWGGNYSADDQGNPVIFDPATYYGDRETDLAMTELFGGFGAAFYAVYNSAYPLDPGYKTRKTLYNLYHILNHLNLFGGSYGSQAESMIDRLLSELR